METQPNEPNVECAELAAATRLEVEAAGKYLDDRGLIDYSRFNEETFDTLVKGPGGVTEPAAVEPHHLGTTTEEFARMSNNFHMLFDEFWGKRRRKRKFYQRFSILFPDLANALLLQYREYAARSLAQQPPSYDIDPEMFESLRVAYGIMAQLIDESDEYGENQQVRDVDPTQVLRA